MIQDDLYHLPVTCFVASTPGRQWWRLVVDVFNIGLAIWDGNLQQAATATWAARQNGETLHRILSGRGADVEMARETMISECLEREEYDPDHDVDDILL